jgi:hypothetical protein
MVKTKKEKKKKSKPILTKPHLEVLDGLQVLDTKLDHVQHVIVVHAPKDQIMWPLLRVIAKRKKPTVGLSRAIGSLLLFFYFSVLLGWLSLFPHIIL